MNAELTHTPALRRIFVALTLVAGVLLLWRPAAGVLLNTLGGLRLNAALLTDRPDALAEAGSAFSRGAALDPRSGALDYNLAAVYAAFGDDDAALRALEAAVAREPDHQLAQFALGNRLAARGRTAAALEAWRAADAALYFAEQGLDEDRGRSLDPALILCERAAALDPDLAEAHLCLGKALADMEEWSAALDAYRRAAALAPRDPEPSYRMGRLVERHGEGAGATAEAESYYRQALAHDPAHTASIKSLMALLVAQGRCAEAVELSSPVLVPSWAPHDRADTLRRLGGCFLETGDPAAARGYLQDAVRAHADSVHSWWLLARANFRLARDAEAADACRRVLALDPDHAQARELLETLEGGPAE